MTEFELKYARLCQEWLMELPLSRLDGKEPMACSETPGWFWPGVRIGKRGRRHVEALMVRRPIVVRILGGGLVACLRYEGLDEEAKEVLEGLR